MIYHITSKANWQKAQENKLYDFCTLKTDGFIHCSTDEQFIEVANRLFKDQSDLLLLRINPDKVEAKIIYENLEGGSEQFPHLYGPLEIKAVEAVFPLKKDEQGLYISPI